jgi:hypothetical protein
VILEEQKKIAAAENNKGKENVAPVEMNIQREEGQQI